MQTENVAPDRFTYSALIKAAGAAADAASLRQLYREACSASGGPDGFIFSALFNSAAQCSGLDSHWLLQVGLTLLQHIPAGDMHQISVAQPFPSH